MRKLLSILLLAAFGLPLLPPILAAGAAGNLVPACCRRNGKHSCTMGASDRSPDDSAPRLQTIPESCPHRPAAVAVAHPDLDTAPNAATIVAGLVTQPAIPTRPEPPQRLAADRSRPKRGPPTLLG